MLVFAVIEDFLHVIKEFLCDYSRNTIWYYYRFRIVKVIVAGFGNIISTCYTEIDIGTSISRISENFIKTIALKIVPYFCSVTVSMQSVDYFLIRLMVLRHFED